MAGRLYERPCTSPCPSGALPDTDVAALHPHFASNRLTHAASDTFDAASATSFTASSMSVAAFATSFTRSSEVLAVNGGWNAAKSRLNLSPAPNFAASEVFREAMGNHFAAYAPPVAA